MSDILSIERFLWFDARTKAHAFPNAKLLSERFEISTKTAQRTIEFMRERMHAPLEYVPARRGYRYTDESYELPGGWISEEELIALLVSYRMASAIPDTGLKKACATTLKQVITRHSGTGGINMQDLADKISVKNIAYSRTDGRIFHLILEHLVHTRALEIEYYSPHNNETTHRHILPLHLLHYMGTWHIIAFCGLKNDLRDFVLSRIKSAGPSETIMPAPVHASKVKDYIRMHFGIMNSPQTHTVCLRFTPLAAAWIAEQVWHPCQIACHEDDGALTLSFPVADFREIKREILKHGSQVEVLSPPELRDQVQEEIQRMAALYKTEQNEKNI